VAHYRLRIGVNLGYLLQADSGSYSLSGQAAALTRAGAGIAVPSISFTRGVASSHDLRQYVSGYSAVTMLLDVQGTALPSGVTFNGTHLVYDGTGSVDVSVSGVLLIVIPMGG
jgi:hypothetical protein